MLLSLSMEEVAAYSPILASQSADGGQMNRLDMCQREGPCLPGPYMLSTVLASSFSH